MAEVFDVADVGERCLAAASEPWQKGAMDAGKGGREGLGNSNEARVRDERDFDDVELVQEVERVTVEPALEARDDGNELGGAKDAQCHRGVVRIPRHRGPMSS